MTKLKSDEHYSRLLSSVKERIRKSQYEALKAVNKELIGLYRDIAGTGRNREQVTVTRSGTGRRKNAAGKLS
jgi:hypothetical protein